MAFPIQIKVVDTAPPEVSQRRFRQLSRDGYQALGEAWWRRYLPDHFAIYARMKYGFQRRTAKWLKRKLALAAIGRVQDGGRVDLVATGNARELLERDAHIRSTADSCTVEMEAPWYMTRKLGGRHPDMADEVTRVIDSQVRRLEETWQDTVEPGLEGINEPQTTEIR